VVLWWKDSIQSPAQSLCFRTTSICSVVALMVLLQMWIRAVHSQFEHGTPRFIRCVIGVLFGVSTLCFVFLIATGIVFFVTLSQEAAIADAVSVLTLLGLTVLLGCTFLVYGIVLAVILWRSEQDSHRVQVKTVVVLAVLIFVSRMLSLFFLASDVGFKVISLEFSVSFVLTKKIGRYLVGICDPFENSFFYRMLLVCVVCAERNENSKKSRGARSATTHFREIDQRHFNQYH
jgi:hypothetical protein